jgi:hypothetical protein
MAPSPQGRHVDRWGRKDRAYHSGDELPAVSLYKIGVAYFVRNGNRGVSVAKYHEVATIDAEVVELRVQRRTDAAQRSARLAAYPTNRPQQPQEPVESWLHSLW